MISLRPLVFAALPITALAQTSVAPTTLPALTVASPRIANQAPASAIAMPVSALRFEPRVDLQSRNLAEGQADVTLRGGTFEQTGFQIGAVTVTDPQTGHYYAELPIAPMLLTAPTIATAADVSLGATNATAGAITYGWRPITTAGAASVGWGSFDLRRADLYQGYVTNPTTSGARFGVDVAWGHSESDGSIRFGEHEFDRTNIRVQRTDSLAQTDLVAAYQSKRFGWPNLYTPFNSNETENLQTTLFTGNHRVNFGGGEFFELGAFHRRNKDDYAFNRFAPLGAVHPFQHTTWLSGAAASARRDVGLVVLNVRAEVLADELKSTSLTFGRYHTRTLAKFALVPEKSWADVGGRTTVKAGIAFDDSNRTSGAVSPVVQFEREFKDGAVRRVFASYRRSSQWPSYTALNSSATAGLFRGNARLGRERSDSAEVGVVASVGGWAVESAVFARRDDALVDWTFRRGVTARTANAVDVDVVGAEVVARQSWRALDLVLGYTALTKAADYRGAAVDASFYALNYARHRFTAAITARLGAGLELHVDNVARVQADNPLRVIGGDETLMTSVGLSYRRPEWHGVEFSAVADNVWNSNFQDVPAVPAARRQIAVGVGYAW